MANTTLHKTVTTQTLQTTWVNDTGYSDTLDVLRSLYKPHIGDCQNSKQFWYRDGKSQTEKYIYENELDVLRKVIFICGKDDGTDEDHKAKFEANVNCLSRWFAYDQLFTDDYEHEVIINPSFKYDGDNVTVTFTLTEAVKDVSYCGRITDKAEALEFIREYSPFCGGFYDYGQVTGYYGEFAFLPRYTKPEEISSDEYLTEPAIAGCIATSLLDDDEIRELLIENEQWLYEPNGRPTGRSMVPISSEAYVQLRNS